MYSRKIFILSILLLLIFPPFFFLAKPQFEEISLQEPEIQDELNKMCQQLFTPERLNIDAMVETTWLRSDMDATLEKEVDAAIEKIKKESDFWKRFLSGWSPSKAEALFKQVANYTFNSKGFRAGIETLSNKISQKLSNELKNLTEETTSRSFLQLTEILGSKYSDAIAEVFQREIKATSRETEFNIQPDNVHINLIQQRKRSLTGIGIIIVSKITQKITQKITTRITTKITTRITGRLLAPGLPIIGWIVGTGLIVWDLVTASDGALPYIEESLKKPEIKTLIKSDIATEINHELKQEMPKLAREISLEVYSCWQDFKHKFQAVLALSETVPAFKQILENASADTFYKLATLVNTIKKYIGETALLESIHNGSFQRMLIFPIDAYQILESTTSIPILIAWVELAGQGISEVVHFEIYKHKQPADFDKQSLTALLALNDARSISQLILLEPPEIAPLLTIASNQLKKIAAQLNADRLKTLSWYLIQLDPVSRNYLIAHLADDPFAIDKIKSSEMKARIRQSPNPDILLHYLFSPVTLAGFLDDGLKLFRGNLDIQLFYHKYKSPQLLSLMAVLSMGLLLILLASPKLSRKRNKARS